MGSAMKTWVTLCLALATLVQGDGDTKPTAVKFREMKGRSNVGIIHGSVAKVGQFPYQVAVFPDFDSFCGGSLISRRWILTAGHCVAESDYWVIYLGAWDMMRPKEANRKGYVTYYGNLHPQYDFPYIDIALIQLVNEIEYTDYISPIKLSNIDATTLVGKSATISGWGLTSDDSDVISPVLRYVSLTVMTESYCNSYYGASLGGGVICVHGSNLKATCSGDSGGPLTYTKSDGTILQIGATSFGSSRGCGYGAPDGFTNVAYFLSWIEDTANETFH